MSFELHELRRARPHRPFPLPAGACRIIGDFTGERLSQMGRASFVLRRRRDHTEIMFSMRTSTTVRFSWNVTAMLKLRHESFAEARSWAHAYAAQHGQTIDEVVKKREKAPTGQDAKLFRAGGCREEWLNSDVPKLFAEACCRCQHPGGFCSSDGYCHYGNCDMEMNKRHSA